MIAFLQEQWTILGEWVDEFDRSICAKAACPHVAAACGFIPFHVYILLSLWRFFVTMGEEYDLAVTAGITTDPLKGAVWFALKTIHDGGWLVLFPILGILCADLALHIHAYRRFGIRGIAALQVLLFLLLGYMPEVVLTLMR